MKDLKTHLLEAIKPPRLSAKNKHLWKQPTEEEIMKWLKDNCKGTGKVDIVDGKINVYGNISLNTHTKNIPYPFGEVTEFFSCQHCVELESLRNCPIKAGHFSCSNCPKITSLEGAPKEVDYDFYCHNCDNLTSLEGAPKKIGRHFTCSECDNLTSLEGAPEEVGGHFECSNCSNLTSLKGAPKKVGGNFCCDECRSLKSLKYAPQEVGKNFNCVLCGASFTYADVEKMCDVKGDIHI